MRAMPTPTCPVDGGTLSPSTNSLRCEKGHSWPVVGGIPHFAGSADDRSVPAHDYSATFGLQWQTFPRTQLDSYTTVPLSRDRARRCLGEALWKKLHDADCSDVLEVGCGAGRFTEVLLDIPSTRVFSIDHSSAVEANLANFPQSSSHQVARADVRHLPFAPQQFDLVFCLGVVQHTPDPAETIAKLYEQVKPGGALALDHYTFDLGRCTALGVMLARSILKRLGPETGMRWSNRLVDALFPLHRMAGRSDLLQRILSRISPVRTYFHHYHDLDDKLQYEWALLDTHDALTDWHKHIRSKAQIVAMLEATGALDIEAAYGGNGVEARCRRPLAKVRVE